MKQLKKIAGHLVSVGKTGYSKVVAGGTALVASAGAMAQAGDSPGAAISGELSGGKADMMLVIAAVAILLGVLIAWAYIKRAR